jgi:hypothetical protein
MAETLIRTRSVAIVAVVDTIATLPFVLELTP